MSGSSEIWSRRRALKAAALGALALAAGPAWASSRGPSRLRLLKVRHSTFLLELDDTRALVDPCFSRGLGFGPLFDAAPPSLLPEDVGALDLLLVTSSRPDHFDPRGVRRLARRDAFCMAPDEDVAKRLRSAGFSRVRVVAPGDVFELRGVKVEVSPSEDGLGLAPQVGYRLSRRGRSVWHMGAPPPVEVFADTAAFARQHPSEVVLACWDGTRALGRRLSMGAADGELLAALAKARFAIPQHDGGPPGLLGALLLERGPARREPLPQGPRVFVVEPGVWYRVASTSVRRGRRASAPPRREGPP